MPWGVYTNKVKKAAFLAIKPALTFIKPLEIDPKPMQFKTGKFGWQATKPNQKVTVSLGEETVDAQVMVTCIAEVTGKSGLTPARFLEAKPALDISGLPAATEPREFQTTSFGWFVHKKLTVMVAGEELQVMVNFQAVLKGTKEGAEDVAASGAEDAPLIPVDMQGYADEQPLLPPPAKKAKT
mmetsp:Transcript_17711/g.41583  ORF Transcript_17711/g.41583 Transcript_17711/m.41583 type:complete len:183 (+) Transcript_17711:77-625(+)